MGEWARSPLAGSNLPEAIVVQGELQTLHSDPGDRDRREASIVVSIRRADSRMARAAHREASPKLILLRLHTGGSRREPCQRILCFQVVNVARLAPSPLSQVFP